MWCDRSRPLSLSASFHFSWEISQRRGSLLQTQLRFTISTFLCKIISGSKLLSTSIDMDSVHDVSSLDRVSEWLDFRSDERSGSHSRGGVPLPDHVTSNHNHQRTIPTSIGLVTRQGLRNRQVPIDSDAFHFTLSGIIHPTIQQQHVVSSPDDKSRYTSRLMEYGQEKHVLPTYEYSTISQTPSMFRCRVKFQGVNTSATASTKKNARHQASFNACKMLGIGPN